MYRAHYALSEEPFGVSSDGRFFFETEQHREALATLYYAIRQRRGFALMVARAGLGKTSVLVQLRQRLEGEAEVAYFPHPYFDRATVLESILVALGLKPTASDAGNHCRFYEYLLKTCQAGKTCVVMIDEAQDLNLDTLEALRMLSNFETPKGKLVQIVLAGQPRLADLLRQRQCEQLRQRLNLIARLRPLDRHEVLDYMAHRLKEAGKSIGLFAPDALDAIASASGGVPRNVNTICFNSLTLTFALNRQRVTREAVEEVLRDLGLGANEGVRLTADSPAAQTTVPESTQAVPQTGFSFRVRLSRGSAWESLFKALGYFAESKPRSKERVRNYLSLWRRAEP